MKIQRLETSDTIKMQSKMIAVFTVTRVDMRQLEKYQAIAAGVEIIMHSDKEAEVANYAASFFTGRTV